MLGEGRTHAADGHFQCDESDDERPSALAPILGLRSPTLIDAEVETCVEQQRNCCRQADLNPQRQARHAREGSCLRDL
jgi:hypothetical protein